MQKLICNRKVVSLFVAICAVVFIIANVCLQETSYAQDNEMVPIHLQVYPEGQAITAGGHFIDRETGDTVEELSVERGKYLSNVDQDPSSTIFKIADDEEGSNPHEYEFIPDEGSVFLRFNLTGIGGSEPYLYIGGWCYIVAHVDQKIMWNFHAGNPDEVAAGAHISNVGGDWNLSEDGSYAYHESRFYAPFDEEVKSFVTNCSMDYPGHQFLLWYGHGHDITAQWLEKTSDVAFSSDDVEGHQSFVGIIVKAGEETAFDNEYIEEKLPVGTEYEIANDGLTFNLNYTLGTEQEDWTCSGHAVAKDGYVLSHYTLNDVALDAGTHGVIEENQSYTFKAVYDIEPTPGPTPSPIPDPSSDIIGNINTGDFIGFLVWIISFIALLSCGIVFYKKSTK